MRWSLLSAAALTAFGLGAQAEDQPEIKSISLRTHTLQQPYLDSDMQSRWFDFGGDTIIRTDSHVRLTSDHPSQEGWLFSRVPLTATNWEVEVEFRISGKHQLYGDGLAMWVTRQRASPGTVFGHTDKFEGLGIFIDTYKNNRPGVVFPYVMAMYGDGEKTYDKNNDGKEGEIAGCSARGIRNTAKEVATKMRVTYFQEKQLKVELMYKSSGEWQNCFDIDNPPAIPNIAYLGFSAETGELSDNHDIISIQSKNLYKNPQHPVNKANSEARASKARKNPPSYKPPKQEGSWTWFFAKVFLVLFVVAGGYVGWTAYRTRQKGHRF